MNILMVLSTGKYPPDRRVEREARDLIRDGNSVWLMARRCPGQASQECVDGVNVIRVPLPLQNRGAVTDFIYYVFQRYLILFHILLACRRHSIQALHVHDLPYALATVIAGKLTGVPVVFDMHEHYTAMLQMGFEDRAYRVFKPLSFLLLAILRFEEKIACRWAWRIIVVADEQVPRLSARGISPDRIVVVTNTEDSGYFGGLQIDQGIIEEYRDYFVILYTGMMNAHRGLQTAIEAMPHLLKEIPNALLLLVGDGASRKELEELCVSLGVKERVRFTGYQPFSKLPSFIETCATGLIPHVSTPHIETTMPNKIFHYMILGKPVVVSNTGPMMRVINDAKCGLIFRERDACSLAQTLIKLKDSSVREEMGTNGRDAVEDRYNWQTTVKALLEIYRTCQ